jgi:steroid 5-alpha reductase family enzyme
LLFYVELEKYNKFNMTFFEVYILAFGIILIAITLLWFISVLIKNVSIVDMFWGLGFVITSAVYFINSEGFEPRKIIILVIIAIWGMRLSGYLTWRNWGKEEDYRYQNFRKQYGEHRYWWFSYFQVFLLQGVLMWFISAPLLAAMFYGGNTPLGILDFIGIVIWIVGVTFESGGDYQLARFKSNPQNKGKVLNTGFWKYTRHPNYFGDAAVWWGFGLMSIAAGSYLPVLGSLLMTILIIKVSGVVMLERTLKTSKSEYQEYVEKTSAFFPWFPKK